MSKDKNNNEEGSDRTYLNFLDSSPNSELIFGELFTKFTHRCITNEAMKTLDVFGNKFMMKKMITNVYISSAMKNWLPLNVYWWCTSVIAF